MNATVRGAFDHSRGRPASSGSRLRQDHLHAGAGPKPRHHSADGTGCTAARPVSAATWGAEGRTESSLAEWIGREVPLLRTLIDQLIRSDRAVLLVDGLDEVPTAHGRTKRRGGSVRDELVRRLARVQSLVIAGRPGAFESAHEELGVHSMLELRPLDDRQIADFVQDLPSAAAVLRSDDGMKRRRARR